MRARTVRGLARGRARAARLRRGGADPAGARHDQHRAARRTAGPGDGLVRRGDGHGLDRGADPRINLPIAVAAFAAALAVMDRTRRADAPSLDGTAAAGIGLSPALVPAPFVLGREWGWPLRLWLCPRSPGSACCGRSRAPSAGSRHAAATRYRPRAARSGVVAARRPRVDRVHAALRELHVPPHDPAATRRAPVAVARGARVRTVRDRVRVQLPAHARLGGAGPGTRHPCRPSWPPYA